MFKRTVPLLLLAALALPATAAAKTVEVTGPLTLVGHGAVRGELASAETPRRVRFRIGGGVIRFLDLGGDMKVVCRGHLRMKARTTEDGQKVVACAGHGIAVVSSSKFRFAGKSRRYGIHIPEGVTGSIAGRFRQLREEAPAPEEEQSEREEAPAA